MLTTYSKVLGPSPQLLKLQTRVSVYQNCFTFKEVCLGRMRQSQHGESGNGCRGIVGQDVVGRPRSRHEKRRRRLRGLGCASAWCKPCSYKATAQVLTPDGPLNAGVSALATDMLQGGRITREEYAEILMADRIYRLHEAAQEQRQQQQQQQQHLVHHQRNPNPFQRRTTHVQLVKQGSPHPISKGVNLRSQTGKGMKQLRSVPVASEAEQPRDPITLEELGSWTWDFRPTEAGTDPEEKPVEGCERNAGRTGGGGGGGKGFKGSPGKGRFADVVVTYNVESLVLYLLESGDFQEPTTRRPLSLVQLADLDDLAARSGAKVKGSLVESYRSGEDMYRARRERR
ncbi:unnamed protein product [Choristocarpus tenellus]